MRVLVTGAGGVVGKTIITKLKKNLEIYATFRNKKPIINKKIILINTKLDNLKQLPSKCDVIIHCAAESPENSSSMNALKKNNVETTKLILKYALMKKVKLIFFMSSMSVYGKINQKLVNENTDFNCQNLYGASKDICEKLILKWSKISHNNYIIFRLPGVVGESSSRNFISETLKKINKNITINVSNPNAYFNNIVHAETLADFINYNINNINKIKNNIFNIASKNPIKMKNIIDLLYKKLNKKKKVNWIEDQSYSFLINYKKIKNFGFRDISVKDCLIKFIEDNK